MASTSVVIHAEKANDLHHHLGRHPNGGHSYHWCGDYERAITDSVGSLRCLNPLFYGISEPERLVVNSALRRWQCGGQGGFESLSSTQDQWPRGIRKIINFHMVGISVAHRC